MVPWSPQTSFLLNLVILTLTTLYIFPNGVNQNAVTFTSVGGIAFGTSFTGIYHSVQQLKGTQLWRRAFLRHDAIRDPLNDENLGPNDPPDNVYMLGSATSQTLISITCKSYAG